MNVRPDTSRLSLGAATLATLILFSQQCISESSEIADGDSYVFVAVDGNSILRLLFTEIDSQEQFYAYNKEAAELIKVKAGRYYLKGIDTVFGSVRTRSIDELTDIPQTFEIVEASITYLGHWNFERNSGAVRMYWYPSVTFPIEPLISLRQDQPWVANHQLFVLASNGTPEQLSWE